MTSEMGTCRHILWLLVCQWSWLLRPCLHTWDSHWHWYLFSFVWYDTNSFPPDQWDAPLGDFVGKLGKTIRVNLLDIIRWDLFSRYLDAVLPGCSPSEAGGLERLSTDKSRSKISSWQTRVEFIQMRLLLFLCFFPTWKGLATFSGVLEVPHYQTGRSPCCFGQMTIFCAFHMRRRRRRSRPCVSSTPSLPPKTTRPAWIWTRGPTGWPAEEDFTFYTFYNQPSPASLRALCCGAEWPSLLAPPLHIVQTALHRVKPVFPPYQPWSSQFTKKKHLSIKAGQVVRTRNQNRLIALGWHSSRAPQCFGCCSQAPTGRASFNFVDILGKSLFKKLFQNQREIFRNLNGCSIESWKFTSQCLPFTWIWSPRKESSILLIEKIWKLTKYIWENIKIAEMNVKIFQENIKVVSRRRNLLAIWFLTGTTSSPQRVWLVVTWWRLLWWRW